MAGPRFVNIDRETPMFLPIDLREWAQDDDLAAFILTVVEETDLGPAAVNQRGSGDAQYPPGMMLSVLLYCYASGLFSSRQIERLTYQHLSVRYLAGNEHPDHDTICKFRRENGALIKATLLQVVRVAGRLGLGRVGTICLDGTKLVADASRRRSFNDQELQAEQARLDLQVEELLAQAAAADAAGEPEPTELPEQLRSRERLREQVRQARVALAEQVKTRAEEREKERAEWKKEPVGECPRARSVEPRPEDRINLTDPHSSFMRQTGKPSVLGYNAQMAVSAERRAVIVAAEVCTQSNDRQQLHPMIAGLPLEVRAPLERVVVDTGYDHPGQIVALETNSGLEIICPPQAPPPAPPAEPATASAPAPPGPEAEATPGTTAPVPEKAKLEEPPAQTKPKRQRKPQTYRQASQEVRARMKAQSESEEGQKWLRLRRTTVEPVFGLIKSVLGFRRFHLRSLPKVNLEWQLVAVAFNCRRLAPIFAQAQRAPA